MKYIFYILILLFAAGCASERRGAVQNEKQNIVYLGVYNPLLIAVERCRSRSIVVTTDNGKIVSGGGRIAIRGNGKERTVYGDYDLSPDHVGNANIRVFKKTLSGLKMVHGVILNVKSYPTYIYLGQHTADTISRYAIWQHKGTTLHLPEMDGRLPVDSFTLLIMRGDNLLFNRKFRDHNKRSHDVQFDEETLGIIKKLRENDRLLIADLTYNDLGRKATVHPPVGFIITTAGENDEQYVEPKPDSIIFDPFTGETKRRD